LIDLRQLDNTDVVPLNEVSLRMQAAPYGLTQEAQHLVLTALVAQRQFEFVTSSGNRINHRSLDLQIIWEDIVGIAKPSSEAYSGDRLLMWVSLLTGDPSLIAQKPSEARLKLIDALSDWLGEWRKTDPVAKFDAQPDEKLNSKLWRTASNVRKTFGGVAETIDSLLQEAVTLDKCLQTIGDAFADSEEEFRSKTEDLNILREFIDRSAELDEINTYLALCESTNDPKIEELRSALMDSISAGYFDKQDAAMTELREQWLTFKDLYSVYYATRHDASMASGQDRRKLNEFLGSDLWTTFAALSEIQWFGRHDMEMAMGKIRELRQSECDADVRKHLVIRPYCDCSFRLNKAANNDLQIDDLAYTVAQGTEYFRQKMLAEQSALYLALAEMSNRHEDRDALSKVKDLIPVLENTEGFPALTSSQIHLLKYATRKMDMSGSLHSERRRSPLKSFIRFNSDDWQELENELDSIMDFPSLNP